MNTLATSLNKLKLLLLLRAERLDAAQHHVCPMPQWGQSLSKWWLAAQLLALWPTWVWMSERMLDGSDDPLGILALAMLVSTLWQERRHLQNCPLTLSNLPWLLSGVALTLLSTLAMEHLPPLFVGLLAMLALTATLLAILPAHIAKVPVLGLAVLALPLLSSLQFYAGYPLRVITAEASSWLLGIFFEVQREGSALLVNSKLIMVDAPCSGVQMAWLGYFTACTIALWTQLNNRHFLLRLPFVGMLILLGNIGRNTLLVWLQASEYLVPEWLHQGIGLVALALVCVCIATLIGWRTHDAALKTSPSTLQQRSQPSSRFVSFTLIKAGVIIFLICSVWAAHTAWAARNPVVLEQLFVEWPHEWDGRTLRPLALSDVEQRFAQGFPGAITRMTDGERMYVLRHVTRATRMLHPAADCYQGLGYTIRNEQLQTDVHNRLWRCFVAVRNGQALQVCERIENANGQAYTDSSAWYWSAVGNANTGPWMAITIAQPISLNP